MEVAWILLEGHSLERIPQSPLKPQKFKIYKPHLEKIKTPDHTPRGSITNSEHTSFVVAYRLNGISNLFKKFEI